jgi:predicted ATPase
MSPILRHLELVRDKVPDWTAYPFTIPAVKELPRLEFHPGANLLSPRTRRS